LYLFAERSNVSIPFRTEQDAEDTGDLKSGCGGTIPGIAVVEKREVRAAFQCKGESLSFSCMQARSQMGRHGPKQGSELQRAFAELRIERLCRRRVSQLGQFPPDGGRNQNSLR
jgi:hypothetical protein